MRSKIAHDIKHRKTPNDDFYTPRELAKKLFKWLNPKGTVLDPAYGTGNFYFKGNSTKDFYKIKKKYDWLVTNPPYSHLDKWL